MRFWLLDKILNNNRFWSKADVYFYLTILIIFLYSLYKNREKIFKFGDLSKRKKLFLGILLIITLFGGYLRFNAKSLEPRIGDSTWEYLQGARYFSERFKIYKCYGPSFQNCEGPAPVSHAAMFSLVNGILYTFIGFSPSATIYLSLIISTTTLVLAYLALSKFLDSKKAALISSAILAVSPLHIKTSTVLDGALSPFSVLSGFFVLLATSLVIKRDRFKNWLFLASSWLLAISFRWENLMLVPISLLLIVLERKNGFDFIKNQLKDKKIILLLLISVFLMVPLLKGLYNYWIKPFSPLSSSFGSGFLFKRLMTYKGHFNRFYGIWGYIVFLLAPLAFIEDKKKTSIGLIWFISFTSLYASFKYGYTSRYMMNTLPPFILLGGLGFKALSKKLKTLIVSYQFPEEAFLIASLIIIVSLSIPVSYQNHREGNIKLLLESINQTGDENLLFSDINTLMAALLYTDTKSMSALPADEKLNSSYFLNTGRCKWLDEEKMETCNLITNKSELIKRKSGWELYYVDFNDIRNS